MAEEFGGGVCGGKWPWNSSRNLFASSPCSLATHDMPSFGWPNHHDLIIDMKAARSSDDSAGSASDGGGGGSSVVIQDVQKPQQTFQMMGISLSSSTAPDEWNQDLLHDSGRSEENYSNFLLDSSMNYQHDWSSTNSIQDSSITSFKQVDQSFPLDQIPLNSISTSTDQCPATCSALSASFPLNPASYGYTSSLLQTLFDTDTQSQQSLLDNQSILNYSSSADQNYQVNLNGFFASLPKASPMVNPSFSNQQTNDRLSNVSSTFLPSIQSQFLPSSLNDKKLPNNLPSLGSKHQHDQEGKESASVAKKGSNEAAFKRQRIETPSPLPTFKVRKEKLGDRITALQQLVSPFGKTDTASVLHEAIDYIKFLHDQVNTLSTPYLKYGSPPLQRHQVADKHKDEERQIRDLKSRGLCLVPISSTFPVASETSSDFWTPTFGGNFK